MALGVKVAAGVNVDVTVKIGAEVGVSVTGTEVCVIVGVSLG